MTHIIAIISICFASAFTCTTASAGRDGAQLLHQVQTLQRIKQAANVDTRTEIPRAQLAYWDSRRSPSQTW
jgi:hypothetical protein